MNRNRTFLVFVTLAIAAATPALGQAIVSTVGLADSDAHSAASIPDFSGLWSHPSYPGFEPPLSGPGPVVNKTRRRQLVGADRRPLRAATAPLVSDFSHLVGDYTNPILRLNAADAVKKDGEMELSGVGAPVPANQCWPGGVPFVFWNFGMQMLQQPDKITILYSFDHEFRQVRMNQPHLARVTSSWNGDSVGHYEGDTLVIDTVGINVGPFAMVDMYGTPHTEALHVVERYRLLDYEATREAAERDAKENFQVQPMFVYNGLAVDPDYKGKGLQLQFTVEDEGVFTTPWSATITYRRALDKEWVEYVCAENTYEFYGRRAVPTADKPDF
jgi:hypothetical protein